MDHPTTQPNITPTAPQNITKELKSYKNKNQLLLVGLVIALILLIFGLIAFIVINNNAKNARNVTNFEECVAAGNPIMESYPRQCRTKDGKLFVEVVDEVGVVNSFPKDNSNTVPEGKTIVYLYFPRDPESYDDPTLIYPTTRETEDENLLGFALNELMKGPNQEEVGNKMFSEIKLTGESNCGGANYTYSILSGTLTLQFCRDLESSGVLADARIKEMLTRTADQFNFINEVILIDKTGSKLFDARGAE